MGTAVASKTNKQIARSPSVLVPLIKAALADLEKSRLVVADLLAEARVGFDSWAEFLSWTHRQFGMKEATATDYLRAGRHRQNHLTRVSPPWQVKLVGVKSALMDQLRNYKTLSLLFLFL